MVRSMHIVFVSRQERRRKLNGLSGQQEWSYWYWTGASQRQLRRCRLPSARIIDVRPAHRFAATHSPALWMNVAPSEWSASVVDRVCLRTACNVIRSRPSDSLVPCYARVRRNRELEDRWLICTRFAYARVGCCAHLSEPVVDHQHRDHSCSRDKYYFRGFANRRQTKKMMFSDVCVEFFS